MTKDGSVSLQDLCTRVQTLLPEQFKKEAWYLIVVGPSHTLRLLQINILLQSLGRGPSGLW
jgi:hypothetical protein